MAWLEWALLILWVPVVWKVQLKEGRMRFRLLWIILLYVLFVVIAYAILHT